MSMANGVQAGGAMQAFGNGLGMIQGLVAADTARSTANSAADVAMTSAGMRARAVRRQAQQDLGSARAAAAASGVSVSSGSVIEAERSISRYSEQDALSILVSGQSDAAAIRARGAQEQAAALSGASDSLVHGADAWQRTRRRNGFRLDDPYRVPGYVGGMEGE